MSVLADPRAPAMAPPAITRDRYHRYTYAGVTYPGVTGILKVLDKSDALMSWAARQTAEAALAQLDNLAGLRSTVGDEGVIKALTARSGWKRDEAASIGTEVHELAELVVTGQPTPPMSETVRSRVLEYAKWWQAAAWRIRLSEAFVVHTGFGYGGTFDLLAYDRDGRTVLADIKTGKGVYGEAVLQLAAYGMAELVAPAGSPTAYPMPPIDRYVVLHVTADGVREIEIPVGSAEQIAFRACIALAAWRETQTGRRL